MKKEQAHYRAYPQYNVASYDKIPQHRKNKKSHHVVSDTMLEPPSKQQQIA